MVRLTDRPDMTLDVYRGRKTTNQKSTLQLPYNRSSFGKYIDILHTLNDAKNRLLKIDERSSNN